MKKELESTAKVRFQDCDPYNHLNNSKYLDYFINAREDQVASEYGLEIFTHAKETGHAWVVGSNQCAYLKPAKTMEDIVIKSQLIHADDRTLVAEMRMYDKDKKHLKSVCWSSFVYINLRTGKIADHPDDLMKLFRDVVFPTDQNVFEQRVLALKN